MISFIPDYLVVGTLARQYSSRKDSGQIVQDSDQAWHFVHQVYALTLQVLHGCDSICKLTSSTPETLLILN